MKIITKIIIITLILSSCLVLTACSRAAEFFVINQSDSTIEIEYTLNLDLEVLDNRTTIPLKMNFDDWNAWFRNLREIEWRETPPNEFTYDSNTQICRLKLAPNEVMRLTHIDYDDFRKTEDFQQFHIINLKINGKYGEITLSGNQMYHQFEKKDSRNYFISYKQKNVIERSK